jgi:hypothetical protein
MLDVMVHACNLSMQEAEAAESVAKPAWAI